MEVAVRDLGEVFQPDTQFEVPVFQRQYVWERERQWTHLWEDIRLVANALVDNAVGGEDGYLEERSLDPSAGQTSFLGDDRANKHFLGPIIVAQIATGTGDLHRRRVIDGQQRLITLQLVLAATQKAAKSIDDFPNLHRLNKMLANDVRSSRPEDTLKVLPSTYDLPPFQRIMASPIASLEEEEESRIAEAWEYFYSQIDEWAELGGDDIVKSRRRLTALTFTLRDRLQIAVIDLGGQDNPQAIFETMNARNSPLLAADLIKNRLLAGDDGRGVQAEQLYSKYWKSLDKKDWTKKATLGRKNLSRVDSFLYYWLQMKLSTDFGQSQTYLRFVHMMRNNQFQVEPILKEIRRFSAIYRHLTTSRRGPRRDNTEGQFLYRLRTVEAATLMPLLLWLYDEYADGKTHEPGDELLAMLGALESFFVRGMLCGVTRQPMSNYFRSVLQKLKQVHPAGPEAVREALETKLLNASNSTRLEWPTDEQVISQIVRERFYGRITQPRIRLIFEAVEDWLRGPKSEERCRRGLTVEHILPVQWHLTSWPSLDESELPPELTQTVWTEERLGPVDLRHRCVHTLGNLTLVTGKLNSAMSNRSWADKHEELRNHSVMRLNQEVLDRDKWDERDVVERSKALARIICQIWPRPQQSRS